MLMCLVVELVACPLILRFLSIFLFWVQTVDLSKLETAALKRYRRHFKLVEVGPNSSKQQLLDAVGRHFMSQELDEFQVITGFMQAVKRLKP
jgi:hypothetical protein